MFQIGQICVGQNFTLATKYNGVECEVIEFIRGGGYNVKFSDGLIAPVHENKLRPKHEPGSWDELKKMIGWRPGTTEIDKAVDTILKYAKEKIDGIS